MKMANIHLQYFNEYRLLMLLRWGAGGARWISCREGLPNEPQQKLYVVKHTVHI